MAPAAPEGPEPAGHDALRQRAPGAPRPLLGGGARRGHVPVVSRRRRSGRLPARRDRAPRVSLNAEPGEPYWFGIVMPGTILGIIVGPLRPSKGARGDVMDMPGPPQ